MPINRNATFLLLLSVVFLSRRICHGGKILVFPFEGSHWINMDILIRALHSRGHSVDVVRTDKSWYIKDDVPHYNTITVPVDESIDPNFINPIVAKIIDIERGGSSALSFVSLQFEMFDAMYNLHRIMTKMATNVLKDDVLMNILKETKYDMVLTDPAAGVGILFAHALQLPLVYNVRWTTTGEGHLDIAPSPLSYIPITGLGLSDKMTFIQRVKNLLFYAVWQFQSTIITIPHYQAVCNKFFDQGVRFFDLQQRADLWLMRVDFVFEFPRPTMPNVVYMGGFQCKPAKPLPEHLEEFVQSSGEHGFILMSMGTFVSELPDDVNNEIAAVFAQLPQKVIWRYKGARPATLGNNTLLVDWMPQNDLLGHPKIKLFVAHGGTNGVYEAIYHGVPVVGIPVFFDQFDNLVRLTERGGAKIVTLNSLDKNFLKAVQEVIHEPSYRLNMQRLSRLSRDQPVKPLDNALFWIEFVMRHKGADHLKAESYRLPWYIYYSVDVFLAAIAVLTLIPLVIFRCLQSCMKRKEKIKKQD